MTKMKVLAGGVFALMVCAAVMVTAQGADSKGGGGQKRMVLDLVVTDTSSRPVTGLTAKDFALTEKGVAQSVTGFQAVNGALNGASANPKVPTEVMIVIDTVNAITDDVSYERKQLGSFLRQNAHLDFPVTILLFNENGAKAIAPASTDGVGLADAVEKVDANYRPYRPSQGFYGELERMELSTHTVASIAQEGAKRPGRKILIWLGQGWPYLDSTDAETNAKQSKTLFELEVTLSTALRLARMSVYAIDTNRVPGSNQRNWLQYTVYSKPTVRWKDATVGHVAVQVLAVQSGGLPISETNQVLSEQIGHCIADASVGYVMLFNSMPSGQKDEFRDFKVSVNKPGVTVRTRVGYYAQP